MKSYFYLFLVLFVMQNSFAQKDSLQIGDHYSEDQLYLNVSYAQFINQPKNVQKSDFSFGISTGFIKDFNLNKNGTFAFAVGIGYGFDSYNHSLKISENNQKTTFEIDNSISSNSLRTHSIEFPVELRWRTSTAKEYSFWRIYAGIKFLYNFSNTAEFTDTNNTIYTFSDLSSYRKLRYGLTLSAGYDAFNIQLFYGLTPIFENATIETEKITTQNLKIGFIFYFL